MDAGAWYVGEGEDRQLVFRFYGNEAIIQQNEWEELCQIVDDIRNGKEVSVSIGYANILNGKKIVKRMPVGEKITLEMLGITTTPKQPQFSKPIRRF